jgi:hypothetical protein
MTTTAISAALARDVAEASNMAKTPTVARYLQDELGQKTVAYLAGIKDAKMVGRWAAGKNQPAELPRLRLRASYELTQLLVAAFDGETAKAWLFGSNSRLDGEAPAWVVRYAKSWDELREVILTARTFAGSAS